MPIILRLAIAATLIALWPVSVHADDATGTTIDPVVETSGDQTTTTPGVTATPDPANPLSTAGGGTPAGGSTGDSTSLQPAGANPLQSTNTDSNGLTAPSNILQGTAPNEGVLKVLSDEADGKPQTPATAEATPWPLIGLAAAILLILEASLIAPKLKRIIGPRLPRRRKKPAKA